MSGNFGKNTLITFSCRVLQLILGMGVSVIIARILGPAGKGEFALAILLSMLLVSFIDLGIGQASVYYIGQKKYSLGQVFGINIIFCLILSIAAGVIGICIIIFWANTLFAAVPREFLLLALAAVPFQIFLFFANNILLGLQKIKSYNFIQLIQSGIYLILVAVFILGFHLGVRAAIIVHVVSLFLSSLILFFVTRFYAGRPDFAIKAQLLADFLGYGVKIYAANVLSFLHFRIDMFMLNLFLNPAAVGFYSIAVTIAEKLWLLSQSAGVVVFPHVSAETNIEQRRKFTALVARNILAITVIAAVSLCVLAPRLITFFYSRQYLATIIPFQILLFGIIPVSLSRILLYDFAGRGKPILVTYLNGISVVLNVVLNIIFIPRFKIVGAAVATSISYTFISLLAVIIYKNISGNKIRDIIFIKKSDLIYYRNFFKRK